MLVAILSVLLFICIGVMTYLILSRQSNKGINIGMNVGDKTIGINVDINKLENKVIIDEISNIADNLGKVQPLLCEQYKGKLRELVNMAYSERDDVERDLGGEGSCSKLEESTEAMLGELIRVNTDFPMSGKLQEINNKLIESIKKIAKELNNVVCNKSTNKIVVDRVFKLLEKGINMICKIGYKNADY